MATINSGDLTVTFGGIDFCSLEPVEVSDDFTGSADFNTDRWPSFDMTCQVSTDCPIEISTELFLSDVDKLTTYHWPRPLKSRKKRIRKKWLKRFGKEFRDWDLLKVKVGEDTVEINAKEQTNE